MFIRLTFWIKIYCINGLLSELLFIWNCIRDCEVMLETSRTAAEPTGAFVIMRFWCRHCFGNDCLTFRISGSSLSTNVLLCEGKMCQSANQTCAYIHENLLRSFCSIVKMSRIKSRKCFHDCLFWRVPWK